YGIARLLLLWDSAAGKGFDARQELGIGVGLGQVVVTAGAQAFDAVVDVAKRREDQDGGAGPVIAQLLHHRETVETRQHAINDKDVVAAVLGHDETRLAVAGKVGGMAAFLQRLLQELRRLLVVLDHQYAHGAHDLRNAARFLLSAFTSTEI